MWHDLASGIKPQWYLKTTSGKNISWWGGNVSTNLYAPDENGTTYADYLSDFLQKKVLATGLWDGLLFDSVWQNVSWVDPEIDMDDDGQKESGSFNDNLWQQGHINFFKKLREKFGNKYLILGNGDGLYHSYINGRMFEGFPEYYEDGWTGSMQRYMDNNINGYQPRINVINSDSNNTGNKADYKTMRYGLASTLLYNGYYSFDFGTRLREHFWWYDEYDAYLGKPKSSAFNLLDRNNKEIKSGVWQRDFESGVVLVNSTDSAQKISFDSEYEKIHGTQDAKTNNGSIINSLEIPKEDGVVLLRPIEKIEDAVFLNGSFARIFNGSGQV
ncbi:MAG: putative glycoside hydrolase, partial [Patescibacteria group bacterium]